ncbi:MAG: hypothetical protein ACWA41_02110 [Putridiphycobacter sp.]
MTRVLLFLVVQIFVFNIGKSQEMNLNSLFSNAWNKYQFIEKEKKKFVGTSFKNKKLNCFSCSSDKDTLGNQFSGIIKTSILNDTTELMYLQHKNYTVFVVKVSTLLCNFYFPFYENSKNLAGKGFIASIGDKIFYFGFKSMIINSNKNQFTINKLSIISLLDKELFSSRNVIIQDKQIVAVTKLVYSDNNPFVSQFEACFNIYNEELKMIDKREMYNLSYYIHLLNEYKLYPKIKKIEYESIENKQISKPLWYYGCKYKYYDSSNDILYW